MCLPPIPTVLKRKIVKLWGLPRQAPGTYQKILNQHTAPWSGESSENGLCVTFGIFQSVFLSVAEDCLDKYLSRGGNQIWMLKPQVNFNVIPIYKSREKRIFEFGDRLHPPHWPSRFSKSLCKGQKSKLSQTYGMTHPDAGEKGTRPLVKELAQSGPPVRRKIQKTTRK